MLSVEFCAPLLEAGDSSFDLLDGFHHVCVGRLHHRQDYRSIVVEPPRAFVVDSTVEDVGHVLELYRTILVPLHDDVGEVGRGHELVVGG